MGRNMDTRTPRTDNMGSRTRSEFPALFPRKRPLAKMLPTQTRIQSQLVQLKEAFSSSFLHPLRFNLTEH